MGAAALAVWYCVPALLRLHQQGQLVRWCSANGVLVLSFDDGPGVTLTGRVLALLEHHQAKATFFLLGMRAQQNPDTVRRIQEAGHEIGSHGFAHLNAWRVSPFRSAEDVRSGFRALTPWTSAKALYRPPHGKATGLTWFQILRRGSRFGWWTIDGGDTWSMLPDVAGICRHTARMRGGVVLLHDFDRSGANRFEREDFVLALVSGLLTLAEQYKLQTMCLGDVLDRVETDESRRRYGSSSSLGKMFSTVRVRTAEGVAITPDVQPGSSFEHNSKNVLND